MPDFDSLLSPSVNPSQAQMPAPAMPAAGFSFADPVSLLSPPAASSSFAAPAAEPELLAPSAPPGPKAAPAGRLFSDAAGMRDRVFSRALTAAQSIAPISNRTHTLRVKDVSYIDPDQFTLAQQKQAILRRETIGRRLRGTWELVDNNTGEVVDSKQQTLARVPFFTQRGTTINNGSEYVMVNQQRLKPGIFTREQNNGDLESHANVAVGTGASHRYYLDPASGKFFLKVGQAKLPLMPLLRSLGATNAQLREQWGRDIFAANENEDDPKGLAKVYDRFSTAEDRRQILDDAGKQLAIQAAFSRMRIDPEVSLRTLGKEHSGINLDTVMDTTKKLLAVSRREQDPDDRDHMANQQVLGAEDFISERLAKDHGNLRRTALFKASLRGNLGAMQSGYLNKQIESALMGSGLAQPLEEVNALEVLDKRSKITRMGEGGIGSTTAIPSESRSVQPSHLGFIDPIRTVESLRAGVDLYLAGNALKGDDGKLYNQFLNRKTGEIEDVSPEQMANSTILFSGESAKATKRGRTRAAGMRAGELGYYPVAEADYEMRRMEDGLSPLMNMLPFKGNSKGQRLGMGSRFLSQALPLINAEAPFVDTAVPGDSGKSAHEEMGQQAGAVFAEQAGRVLEVTPDGMLVKQDDGTTKNYELYNNMPSNRKSAWHNTPLVRPGDRVDANSVLAKSNYTDDKGSVALGLNSRVAYMTAPSGSSNYEDAIAISESYAKRLTSDHMYQHDLETHDALRTGKKAYLSLYPGKFNKAQLDNFTDDGLIKPGTVVRYGDPLILGATETKTSPGKIHKKGQSSFKDASQLWGHNTEGVVTDVVQTAKGMTAIVKSTATTVLGDKLAGRFGDKGVVTIVPDERMPIGENGQPFEVLLNPLSLISRSNASQALEAQLGKISAITGKSYKVGDFESTPDAIAFVQEELAKHGLKDTETVTDPETGRKIANVFTGNRYLMKLAHMAEDKGQGRGLGAYTSAGEPARGGDTGSKRLGLLDVSSLLSHSALNVLQDAGAVKGQQNDTYWLQFMQGNVPDKPKVPMVFEKFVSELKASGVNVVPEGRKLRLMSMTDKDVDILSEGREITTADTVRGDADLTAIAGGLFDKQLTGGHGGKKWSYVKLAAPMPNPAFEEPIKKLLGLTGPKFESILAGKEQLNGKTGSEAIQEALAAIKLDPAIELTSALVKSGRGATRDAAIKKLNYLKSAQKLNMHPVDWMLTKVPVLPPVFRPISMMQGSSVPLISDANYLYKELISANNNLKDLTGQLDDVGEERSAVYSSLKAVTGLGEPAQVKLQDKGIQGLLKHVVGSSPKTGTMQRKLIGQNVDLIGRAVVTPNADLDMDSVGLPEAKAWDVYKNFVVRRLKRNGMPLIQAMREANDRTPLAKKELLAEMSERPVILNRAPVWHKYGILALRPQLVKGNTIQTNTLINAGFNLDHDGDTMSYSVPVGDAARLEALDKMLPSRNLLSTKDLKSAMHVPSKEMSAGLYQLTTDKSEKHIRTFATRQDAMQALQSGEIDPGDRVSILS